MKQQLSRFQIASIKRTAKSVKKLRENAEKYTQKLEELQTQLEETKLQIEAWETPIQRMTGCNSNEILQLLDEEGYYEIPEIPAPTDYVEDVTPYVEKEDSEDAILNF